MKDSQGCWALAWAVASFASGQKAVAASHDANQELLDRLPCRSELQAVLAEWKPQGSWRPALGEAPDANLLRAPTDRIGTWIQLEVTADQVRSASLIQAEKTIQISWSLESKARALSATASNPGTTATGGPALDCRESRQTFTRRFDPKVMGPALTDAKLGQIVQTHPKGLIYAWSPQMPLSVRGFRQAQAATQHLGLAFIPVLDADADLAAAEGIVRSHKWPVEALRKNESLELVFREVPIHYPSALIFAKGRIVGDLRPGYENEGGYAAFIKKSLPSGKVGL